MEGGDAWLITHFQSMKDQERTIREVRDLLQRRTSPRLHMLALVTVTAACGLLSSYILLHVGVTRMFIRYPLAVGLAYVAFLGLVAIWLRRFHLRAHDSRRANSRGIEFDVVELPIDAMWGSAPRSRASVPTFGGGGDFSGGGSSGSWSNATTNIVTANSAPPSLTGGSGGSAGGGWDLDLDEGALWLIPVAIIGVVAFSVLVYVVYIAPALFAELLLDVGLAAGLYRRLANVERRSWLTTAIRNTAVPAFFVAALLALSGSIMQAVYPDVVSVGGVVHHVLNSSRPQPSER